MKDVEINHHENGDSEFIFPVTMMVGATDSNGDSNVNIGGIRFNIHKIFNEELKQNEYILQEGSYDTMIYGSPHHESKADAIRWLIDYVTIL